MAICHVHNLREPFPKSACGLRVTMMHSDPLRSLVGRRPKACTGTRRAERSEALKEMSGRYIYFRPGDRPTLEFATIDP
jgi:hypothetical protein